MSSIEYRVVYLRDGRRQYREGFPKKDVNWGGYFHNIREGEVVGWEERTISDWRKSA
jgi:hypothetical protein